jgi:hypothetical protein
MSWIWPLMSIERKRSSFSLMRVWISNIRSSAARSGVELANVPPGDGMDGEWF